MSNYTTADIQIAYVAFFGRAGEPSGVDFWASVSNDVTMEQMYADFANQPEYRAYYADFIDASTGEITDAVGMLNEVYNNLFHRDIEAGGVSFWAPLLTNGTVTIDDVVLEVYAGAQNEDKVAVEAKLAAAQAFEAEARATDYMGYTGAEAAEDAHNWLSGIYNETTKDAAIEPTALHDAVVECIAPDGPIVPTYDLSADAASVNEGNAVTFTLETTHVAAGTSYAYTLSGVQASDVVGGTLSGTAVVGADGKAVVTVELVADATTEGNETMTMHVAGQAESVTVVDSSVTPPVPTNQYFTTGTDHLFGSAADEFFAGTVSSQDSMNTFQPGDTLDAGDGFDTLEIELDTNYNGNVAVTGVEKLSVEVTSTATDLIFEAEEMFNQNSGLKEVWMENLSDRNMGTYGPQSGTLIIRDIATSDVTLGVKDSGSVVTGASNPSPDLAPQNCFNPEAANVWYNNVDPSAAAVFEFSEDQLLGSNDAIGLALDNVRNVSIDINVGNSGEAIEVINVNSIASIPSRVNSLNGSFAADGNASTMNVVGAAGFTAELAGNFTTFNAEDATGSQKIKFDADGKDLDVTGGSAGDIFEMNAPSSDGYHVVMTNGGDDQVFILGGGDAKVGLGDGADILCSVDTVAGDSVEVYAGAGDDKIKLGDGDHIVYGEDGNDDIYVGDGDSFINAGNDNDSVSVGDGDSEVYMGAGDDTLTVRHADYLDGADIFNGGEGNNDTIIIGDLLDRSHTDGCDYYYGAMIDESDLYGVSHFENLNLEADGVRLVLSDELIQSSDSGTFTVNIDGTNDTIDLLTPEMASIAALTINDRVELNDTTVIVDRQYGNATLNLGDGYDTLELWNSANLRAADLNKISGLDEILLRSAGTTEDAHFEIELTEQFMDQCDDNHLTINVDDDLPANSTLTIDLREVDLVDESLTVVFNGNLNSGDVELLGDAATIARVVFVESQELTHMQDTLIPGSGTTDHDDLVVASDYYDFNEADVIIGGGQYLNYTFRAGGDELRMEYALDLLDHSTGVAFIGAAPGETDSNTGALSQLWGYNDDDGTGGSTVDGFERITFHTNNDVSFVDDVTTVFGRRGDMGIETTYAENNSNISDTGHVVFETGCGDDYIMTGDWNSAITNAGDDVIELFEHYHRGVDGVCDVDRDAQAYKANPNSGDSFDTPSEFNSYDTGTGSDRIIMNSATTQVGQSHLFMGVDDAGDVVELRSWDAVLPDGGDSDTIAQVIVNAGSFSGDTGLEILEYAAKDCGDNVEPMQCQDVASVANKGGIQVGTTITLNDSDFAAFEGNTAVVRPTSDNQAALVFDSTAVTKGQVDVTGSHMADIIETGLGDDIIHGGNGNDYIHSGAGNDKVYGGDGNDAIFAADGNDYIDGGTGDDKIDGGTGNDTIYAGEGRDCVHGGTGADSIHLGANDGASDTVVYETAMEGALPGMNSGYDNIYDFEVSNDRVVIADPLFSDIDGQGIPIAPTDNGHIDWAPENSELVLRGATLGLLPVHEAVLYTHEGAGITDAQLVEDGFATVLDKINNTGVQARLGDQGLFVIQGEHDTAIYLYNESMTDAGLVHASVEAGELQLLGVFHDALLTEANVEFGATCCHPA